MPSLILEGGTLRAIFSAGVMDALLDEDLMFPYCIGVSAGISNGYSYISKQKRRNLEILEKYRHDNRYIGVRNFFRCRSLFGLDFIFGEVPGRLIPFDTDTFKRYEGRLLVGVTNAKTGQPEYIDGLEADERYMMLRATCALPIYFPAIQIGDNDYYDGGICDPIPIHKAIEDGNEKHLIVLTQPKGYRKVYSKRNEMVGKLLRRKYPHLEKVLVTRYAKYNETVEFCEELEREGRAVILRPQGNLNSFEKDLDNLRANCQEGYDQAMEKMASIHGLFQ
ncbi:patatin-like phospholipase family protein [Gorillibacterium massiliense]|uniref:patatin-like phospholipase family protein n=1 Tax=Gorillibacterium massiliense TaxID=1280390 RepID=UPI0004B9803B|nr:patatin family protein [Gorillibacterium massiliense]